MSARYEFIDAEKVARTPEGRPKYPVVKMCEWLEVSTSGYYERCHRPPSATATRREYLRLLIQQIFDDSDATYGYRRVHAQLARQGERCTPELVRSIMRERDLVPCQPRPWRHSLTDADPTAGPIPDLLTREFTAQRPGENMVGSGSRRESHPPAPHGTVRNSLPLHGSCHPDHQKLRHHCQ